VDANGARDGSVEPTAETGGRGDARRRSKRS